MNPSSGTPGSTAGQEALRLVAQGDALQQAGDRNGAAQAYQQAIRVAPLDAAAYRALLDLLVPVGDMANAKRVMQAVPAAVYAQSPAIRFHHACILQQTGQPGEALAMLESLAGNVEVEPSGLAFNLGLCHTLMGHHADALPDYEHASKLGLCSPMLYSCWARSTQFTGDIASAERLYREAARNWPDIITFTYELAILLLKAGQYAPGFRLYQHRWEAGLPQFQNSPAPLLGLPLWDGAQPLRSLLVTKEQGIGDQIVFSALLPALAHKVEHLAVSFDPRLTPLLRRTWPSIEIPAPDESLPSIRSRFEACLSAADMGAIVPEAIGWKGGYLQPDLERAARLREKYRQQFPGKKLVGISWMSKQSALNDAKNVDLLAWRPLLEQPDCQFINLQYGEVAADLARVRDALGVEIHQDPEIDPMQDLDGLAAQMAALDLVITTSNSTAHIAAATRAPTWIILPSSWGLLWYWGYKEDRCDWYPDARLFRAHAENDWGPVMAAVAIALQQECGAPT